MTIKKIVVPPSKYNRKPITVTLHRSANFDAAKRDAACSAVISIMSRAGLLGGEKNETSSANV